MSSAFQISLRVRPILPYATAIVDAVRRNLERCLLAIGVLLLASSVIHPISLAGQSPLNYDRTTFLHGFNGTPGSWLTFGTPSALSQYVFLGANGYLAPQLDGTNTIYAQRNQLRDTLNYFGGAQVLVGHSMGGLVARAALQSNGANIAGIITVGTPHEGTLLANNANNIVPFFTDVQRRVDDAYWAVDATSLGLMHFFVSNDFPKIAQLAALFNPHSAAIADLRTDSPTIATLDNQYDWVPHANVYGVIPTRNAVLRVAQSLQNDDAGFDGAVSRKSSAKSGFKACKHIGYALIVTSFTARKCAWADKVLGRIDDRWATWVNGSPSDQPFDGVVTNARQVYPGSHLYDASLNFQANLVDHNDLTYHVTAIAQIANAMFAIGMQRVAGGGQTLTAAISGPDAVNTDWYSTWSAQVSGGTPPYTYSWSGLFYGNGSSVSGSTSSTGDLILDVYDAASSHVTSTKTVTSTGCSGQYLC